MPDQVGRGTDAMSRGGAGRRDRIAQAKDAECGGQRGRHGGAHRARHHERPHFAHALVAQQVGRLDLPLRRTAAGARHHAGARMAHLVAAEAGVGDGRAHREIGIGRGVAHEAAQLAVDGGVQPHLRRARHLAAQAARGVVGDRADAALQLLQRARHRVRHIAEAGHDAHAGHHHAAHLRSPPWTGTGPRACRRPRRSGARPRRSCRRRSPARACRASPGGCRSRSAPASRWAAPAR